MNRIKSFYDFMIERESIRIRRLAGLPRDQWTNDEIFKKYSFTNIKRHHDRTTMLLKKELYDAHSGYPPKVILLNCALSRYFGTIETSRLIGWVPEWNDEQKNRIRHFGIHDELRYTSAYLIPSCGRSDFKHNIVLDIIDGLWNNFDEMLQHPDWESWTSRLASCYGCGSFMAKEILLDFILATRRTPSDWTTWSPVGPGGKRGASRIEYGFITTIPEYEALEVIRNTYAVRDQYWPKDMVELDLTDIQFQFCEFDKYSRVAEGRRPKRNFRPTVDEVTCAKR